MKNKNPLFFLQDIECSLQKIFKYTSNITYEQFISNDMLRDAVERNFEIIGEAVKICRKSLETNIRIYHSGKLPA